LICHSSSQKNLKGLALCGLDLTQYGEEAYVFETAPGFLIAKELARDLPAPTAAELGSMPTLSEAGD
jgi:hypothetical protein